ncbi:MAG: ATP-dependent DNA helicase [Flavobacterium sp.]
MNAPQFYQVLRQSFPFHLTLLQDIFLQKIANFSTDNANQDVFILKGYAGTGKTTLIASLVQHLSAINKKAVLLAPTGRAAKVISNYAHKPAFTIHKKIYFPKKTSRGIQFTLQTNKHKDTLFIVDEASMISDHLADGYANQSSLLDDLMKYVYQGERCKVIFVGDGAQLPPVHFQESPALMLPTFERNYDKSAQGIELDEVMRQEEGSGILHNATLIRAQLRDSFFDHFQFELSHFKDIVRLQDGYDIQDALMQSYSQQGLEETAFIVRSNKRANLYNQQIRNRILFKESVLSVGDYLMVVKNNYFWLDATDEAGFIANGDTIEVLEIYSNTSIYALDFMRVKVRMIDYPNQRPFETILILNTLSSETPSMSNEESNKFYQEVLMDYQDIPSYQRNEKVKNNEYFNALQIKFSYAMTCHKSQGGQWQTVFIEQPYLPNGVDQDYLRWLYTALTRAKEKVYLIGFKDESFIL